MNDEKIMTDATALTPVSPTLVVTKDKSKIQKYLENSRKIDSIPDICKKIIISGTIEEMILQQEQLLSTMGEIK